MAKKPTKPAAKRGRPPKQKPAPKKPAPAPEPLYEPGVKTYEVLKGVPMPILKRNRRNRFPFDQMKEVGDSFIVPESEIAAARQVMKQRNGELRKRKAKLIFESRKLPDGTLGIWLQADRWQ